MNKKFINDIEVGEIFLHPFHHTPNGQGIFRVSEICEMSTRFGSPNRIVKGELFVPKTAEYATLKFIEECSLWAGSLKKRIPNNIEINFE